MMKAVVLACSIIILFLTSFNCKSPTAPGGRGISISVADVSCTEVWLNFSANNVTLPANIIIKKNGNNFLNLNLTTKDTTLYDSTLSPNQTYTYQAQYNKGFALERSGVVTAKTLDTTSSNFTWQTYTFGSATAGSSYLNDVAIINDTDIIAVGAVYLTDSTGRPNPNAYNLLKWNGYSWELKKIFYYGDCSAVKYPPLKATCTFADNKIVITNGGSIGWLSGDTAELDCRVNSLLTGAIIKIWGSTSINFYLVGNMGNIFNNQNGTWQKIESGTKTNISDIWGVLNSKDNTKTILCAVSNKAEPGDEKILSIKTNNTVDSISWNTGREVRSIWFKNIYWIFACGDGVFISGRKDTWNEQTTIPKYYANRIRGTGDNDVMVCGDFGLLAHFNGIRWISYSIPGMSSVVLTSLDIKGNTVAVTGEDGSKAYVIIGRR